MSPAFLEGLPACWFSVGPDKSELCDLPLSLPCIPGPAQLSLQLQETGGSRFAGPVGVAGAGQGRKVRGSAEPVASGA